ncbi:MAG: bifunctional adenosylcobinamide kinase/adenosylcobinamide-phosphate guanylyltransferase [Bacteroidales bacterium]
MAYLTFITGGQRSGKSSYAKQMAEKKNKNPIYVATSRVWDKGHEARIKKHKEDRGEHWTTIEEEKYISKHNFNNKTVVIDCVTLWLTNFFYDNNQDIDNSLAEAKKEFDLLYNQKADLIIISNELGMGAHPASSMQMKFNDLQGWVNQYIAYYANDVYFMISGIAQKIK